MYVLCFLVNRARPVLFHTDASQSIGKLDVDVESMGIDMLTIAGHKLYCPAGVGALYVRKCIQLPKFMHGAGEWRERILIFRVKT